MEEFKELKGLTDEQIKRLALFGKEVLEIQGVSNAISLVSELLKRVGSDLEYGGCKGEETGWVIMALAEYLNSLSSIEKELGSRKQTLYEYMGIEFEEGFYLRDIGKKKE